MPAVGCCFWGTMLYRPPATFGGYKRSCPLQGEIGKCPFRRAACSVGGGITAARPTVATYRLILSIKMFYKTSHVSLFVDSVREVKKKK